MQAPELINEEASRWMKRGLELLTENNGEALSCFDQAIKLRQTLRLRENAWYHYVLAGGWMNRADALTRLGGMADAVASYDEALAILQTLDLNENPLFRTRLALSWINRGVSLQQQALPAAVEAFANAIAIAQEPKLRAASLTNYGNALLQFSLRDLANARRAFEEALPLLANKERTEIEIAEISLKARRGLFRAIAAQLAEAKWADRELAAAATDAVEEALGLARHWQQLGENRLQDLAIEMMHFGARAYRLYQPQFLADFLAEMLPAFHHRRRAEVPA
jgi:tetratricopeptide (TPR) repeat protein